MDNPATSWEYAGRRYGVTGFSDVGLRDGFGWELEDLTADRRILMEAFWDDSTGAFTFQAFTDQELPFELVFRFIIGAAQGVPPVR